MAKRQQPYGESSIPYVVPGQKSTAGTPPKAAFGPHTYVDYAQTPEYERYQLLQGFLVREPAPFYGHQALSVELSALARNWKVQHGGVIVFAAPFDVFFDKYNVLQPDLLIFDKEMNRHLSRRGLETAPDLVVEILSPSTRHRDTHVKFDVYSRFGVKEYWIVDPREREITRFIRKGGKLQEKGTSYRDGELTSAAFPTFVVTVEDLFSVLNEFD